MEEEKKVVEPVEEEKPVEVKEVHDEEATKKNVLTAFIMSLVGLALAAVPFLGIASIILGALALKKEKPENPERNPHRVFKKVAHIVGIVDIPLGILSVIGWLIYIIVLAVGAAVAAAEGAQGYLAMFLF